jgi:hypothetical protein
MPSPVLPVTSNWIATIVYTTPIIAMSQLAIYAKSSS